MSIYAIGAWYGEDVSKKFIAENIAGPGWGCDAAPELHQFISSLKVGDIIYIKSFSPSSDNIRIKAIGIIADNSLIDDSDLVSLGRRIKWLVKNSFVIPKPKEKIMSV